MPHLSPRLKLAACVVASSVILFGLSLARLRAADPAKSDPPAAEPTAKLEPGVNGSLHGMRLFPDNDPWNTDISAEPVDPNSAALVASIGLGKPLHPDFGTVANGAPAGMQYVVVTKDQPKVKVVFEYAGESDPGPYPVPHDGPIEGGPTSDGGRHVLIIDRDAMKLYELFSAFPQDGGTWWKAGSGAIWDLNKISYGQREKRWTSSDAAGLPVLPGLVRYDEVSEQKEIRHALRFTAVKTRHAYTAPATHYASNKTDPHLPPMGLRVRLKASYDLSKFSPTNQVILRAIQRYGLILADNGSDWFITGSPSPHWDEEDLHQLTRVKGADFEVVKMGEITTR